MARMLDAVIKFIPVASGVVAAGYAFNTFANPPNYWIMAVNLVIEPVNLN